MYQKSKLWLKLKASLQLFIARKQWSSDCDVANELMQSAHKKEMQFITYLYFTSPDTNCSNLTRTFKFIMKRPPIYELLEYRTTQNLGQAFLIYSYEASNKNSEAHARIQSWLEIHAGKFLWQLKSHNLFTFRKVLREFFSSIPSESNEEVLRETVLFLINKSAQLHIAKQTIASSSLAINLCWLNWARNNLRCNVVLFPIRKRSVTSQRKMFQHPSGALLSSISLRALCADQ